MLIEIAKMITTGIDLVLKQNMSMKNSKTLRNDADRMTALNGPVGVATVGAKARRCKKLRNVEAAALGPATPLTELRAEKEERGVLATLDGVRCNALSPDEMHIVYGKLQNRY